MLDVSSKYARRGMKSVRWYKVGARGYFLYGGAALKITASSAGGVVLRIHGTQYISKLEVDSSEGRAYFRHAQASYTLGAHTRYGHTRVPSQSEYNFCRVNCLGIPIFPRQLWYNSSECEDVACYVCFPGTLLRPAPDSGIPSLENRDISELGSVATLHAHRLWVEMRCKVAASARSFFSYDKDAGIYVMG